MRYLIFGDVHANLEALHAVLDAGDRRGVDAYLFVGDLVGYGPDPLECIQCLLGLQQRGGFAWVAGNHELAVRGDISAREYSVEAQQTLAWTQSLVTAEPWALKFLESAPLTTQVNETIWLTHESLTHPGSGRYNRESSQARPELLALAEKGGRICFYGHTHRLRAEWLTAEKQVVLPVLTVQMGDGPDPNPLRLGDGHLGWVGVGSVGFPLNPERRAEFVILDEADWSIEKYAVPYARERIKARTATVLTPVCGAAVAERIARWL